MNVMNYFSPILVVSVAAILIPLANKIGLVDRPDPGSRKIHQVDTPLVGGLVVFFVMFALAALNGLYETDLKIPLMLTAVIFLLGIADDMFDLSAASRVAVQLVTAGAAIAISGLVISEKNFFGLSHLSFLFVPLTLILSLGIGNSINLIDGIDGLAASISLTVIVGLALMAGLSNNLDHVLVLLKIYAASIVGFLALNFKIPGFVKVFLGSSGSLTIGFTIFWLMLYFSEVAGICSIYTIIWLQTVPVFDTVYVMVRRLREGVSPFKADNNHVHHLLLCKGYSSTQALLILLIFNSVLAAFGVFLFYKSVMPVYVFGGLCVSFLCYFVLLDKLWAGARESREGLF